MKKIKVIHIITKLELGGAQGNTLYTVENLNRDQFEVVLISGTGGILDEKAKKIPDTKTFFIKDLIRSINPIKDVSAFCELLKILRQEKPDIVHTHSSKAGIIGRWAAYFAKVPSIIHTFHGFGFNPYQKLPVRWMFVFSEQITAPITHKLVAVAEEDIKKGVAYKIGKKEQYTLIRSGIKLNDYQNLKIDVTQKRKELNLNSDEKIVLTIGPFKPQKNLVDFVRLAGRVTKVLPNTKFLIVGDGEQRQKIETEVNNLRLKNIVVLLGWRQDIAELITLCDVFVLTSLWEGLPRTILEAMAVGKPVVANAVDGTKEIVQPDKTGYLVEPFQINKMAEYVVKLLNDKNLRNQFSNYAKQCLGQTFDIDYMVHQQEELYNSLKIKSVI